MWLGMTRVAVFVKQTAGRLGNGPLSGGSGGPPADVEELVVPFGHRGLDADGDFATAAAAEPGASLGTEASSWSGTATTVSGSDVETDVVPTAGSGAQVLAAADRSRAFTASPSGGLVAGP